MDTDTVESLGLQPIAEQLRAHRRGHRQPRAWSRVFGRLRRDGIGGPFLIDVDSDPADPDRYVLNLYQGGIGLPDESYYTGEQFAPDPRGLRRVTCRRCWRWPGWTTPRHRAGQGDRAGDRARRRALGPGPVQGQLADLQPEGPGRAGRAAVRPQLWDAWLGRARRAGQPCWTRSVVRQPDYVHALACVADRRPAAGLEGLADLADRPVGGAVRAGRPGGEELRLLRPDAVRGAAAARAVEARRRVRRGRRR